MSKWKCDICNSEFNNYHAEGFNNKIYCPLCYYKHEYNDLKQQLSQLQEENETLKQWDCNKDTRNSRQRNANAKLLKENTKLKQENEAMKKLIEWIEECDFGFDNFVNDYEEDINMTEEEFDKETENMSCVESMVHYAKLYIKNKGE